MSSSQMLAPAARPARVRQIATMMSRGEWNGTPSTVALASAWGVETADVQAMAREAVVLLKGAQ